MKGLIFDIKRFAIHDGPGVRVTIFFKGCPLGCWWCHNPESRNSNPEKVLREQKVNGKVFEVEEAVGTWMTVEELMPEIEKERIFFEDSDGGVTFSGGEPLQQHDFLNQVLSKCNQNSIHTALDTTGFASKEVVLKIMDKVDLFLYDIKHLDDTIHKKFTGISNRLIFENMKLLYDKGKNINIRFPVIPGVNNDEAHIDSLLSYLMHEVPNMKNIDLLPYHNIADHKYEKFKLENRMKDVEKTYGMDIEDIKVSFEEKGFQVQIGG